MAPILRGKKNLPKSIYLFVACLIDTRLYTGSIVYWDKKICLKRQTPKYLKRRSNKIRDGEKTDSREKLKGAVNCNGQVKI